MLCIRLDKRDIPRICIVQSVDPGNFVCYRSYKIFKYAYEKEPNLFPKLLYLKFVFHLKYQERWQSLAQQSLHMKSRIIVFISSIENCFGDEEVIFRIFTE